MLSTQGLDTLEERALANVQRTLVANATRTRNGTHLQGAGDWVRTRQLRSEVVICILSLLCGSLNLALAGVLGEMKMSAAWRKDMRR